jgi:hypothetical protein
MVDVTGFENLDYSQLRPDFGDGDNNLEFIDRFAIRECPSFFAYWRAFATVLDSSQRSYGW